MPPILPVGPTRCPIIAESMIRHLEVGGVPCFQAARQCREVVEEAGLVLPSWMELSHSPTYHNTAGSRKPPDNWTKFVFDVVWPGLSDARRALLRSQHGPLASAALTALPSSGNAHRLSAFSCAPLPQTAFTSPSLADVAANLTCLAIIAQRAGGRGAGEAWVPT